MKNFKQLMDQLNEDITYVPPSKLKNKTHQQKFTRRREIVTRLISHWNNLKPDERKTVFKSHRAKLKLMNFAATLGMDVASDPNDKWAHIRHIEHTGERAFKFPASEVMTTKTEIKSVTDPHHLGRYSSKQSEKLRYEGIRKRRGK